MPLAQSTTFTFQTFTGDQDNPDILVGGEAEWSNPGNAIADDATNATADIGALDAGTKLLRCTNPLPWLRDIQPGASLAVATVHIYVDCSFSGAAPPVWNYAKLRDASGPVGSDASPDTAIIDGGSVIHLSSFGTHGLTIADIQASTFGVEFGFKIGTGTATARVDYVYAIIDWMPADYNLYKRFRGRQSLRRDPRFLGGYN